MTISNIFIATIPIVVMMTLAWGLGALLLKAQRFPAQLFCLASIIITGCLAYGYIFNEHIYTTTLIPVMAIGMNFAFICIKKAFTNLMNLNACPKEDGLLFVFTLLIGLVMFFAPGFVYFSSILMPCIASLILIRTAVQVSLPLKDEFNGLTSFLVTMPLAVVGCLYAMLGIAVLTDPSVSDFTLIKSESITIIIALTIASLVPLNLGFAAAIIGRMIGNSIKLTMQDSLTGLANRKHIELVINLETIRANRSKKSFSLLFIDLDYFHQVNEKMGQVVGDEIIIAVAHVLKETARLADTVGRVGGEEFIVILPDTDRAGAEKAAERFRKSVEVLSLMINRMPIKITASIGVAEYQLDGKSMDLLHQADQALHQAKQQGRNTFVVFDTTAPWVIDPIGGRTHHREPNGENPYLSRHPSSDTVNGTEKIQESLSDILLHS